MNNISERAMLALPAISLWTARRYDRKVSDEVAEKHQAQSTRAGRYNKCLIDPKASSYVALTKIAGEARRWHAEHTLPWSQDGARILSSAMYEEYTTKMSEFKMAYDHAVAQFIRDYPALKLAAQKELNGLYKDRDYPSAQELLRKFGFRVSILPVPASGDFRVALDAEDVSTIKDGIEMEVRGAIAQAQKDRWERLMTVVSHAVERLSSPDAIFRDSLIDNIKSEVALLPKLALAEDAMFDQFIAEVKQKLVPLNPEMLREDVDARALAARKAADIMRKMGAFMGR